MPRLRNKADVGPRRSLRGRLRALETLLDKMRPVPEDWRTKAGVGNTTAKSLADFPLCTTYAQAVRSWRKAMKWTKDLDYGLSVMLAASASTNLIGEQLWFIIEAPPSSGKTTLVEGLALNRERFLSRDTITGLYSGSPKAHEGDEDLSIAGLANRKTFALKDLDGLLSHPNLVSILGEMRGLYDKAGRPHYRNGVVVGYEGHRMSCLWCGTKASRQLDDTELGTRFLRCILMDSIDDDHEDEVIWRAVNSESNAMLVESDGEFKSQHPAELVEAMEMTAGYLEYLHVNVVDLLSQVVTTPEQLRYYGRLGKYVAYLRARPSTRRKNAEASREFAPRLGKLLVRFAKIMAVVLNQRTIDGEVMRRTRRIALDSGHGISLDLCDVLYREEGGCESKALSALFPKYSDLQVVQILRFLREIGATELKKIKNSNRWFLTDRVRRLFQEVHTND